MSLQDVCLTYQSLYFNPFLILLNPPISRLNGYIHLFWTGLYICALYAKCTGKCSIQLKNLGEKILSNLQRIMGMFFSITKRLSMLIVDEYKFLKYLFNSLNGL